MSATFEEAKKLLLNALPLFEGTAPGSEELRIEEELFTEILPDGREKVLIKDITMPKLIPFIPEKCNGTAVIVIPGGGFRRQVVNFEGIDVARWLNEQGFAAFVLLTRYPVNAHRVPSDVPLIDAQRAMRIVRSRAEEFGISPDKIGVMGFSAGGHAASCLATVYDSKPYPFDDSMEHISARPDFAVLAYPAICYEAFANTWFSVPSDKEYLADVLRKYSTDKLVHDQMPPVFIFETDNDKTTPAENSVNFYMAARKAGVPAELHIFKEGGHGFGLSAQGKAVSLWKDLFLEWLPSLFID